MKNFLSGKANKVVALLLLFFVPRMLCDTLLEYDYEISSVVGIIAVIMFMRHINKSAAREQKARARECKPLAFAAAAVFAAALQLAFLSVGYRLGGSVPNGQDWLTYKNVVDSLLLAPISEEIFMRWALVEICISEDTKTYKKIIFLILSLLLWTALHGITVINVGVILMGVIFYAIYFRTKNLLYCVVLHIFVNSAAFILESPIGGKLTFLCESGVFLAADTVLTVLSFCVMMKMMGKVRRQDANLQ